MTSRSREDVCGTFRKARGTCASHSPLNHVKVSHPKPAFRKSAMHFKVALLAAACLSATTVSGQSILAPPRFPSLPTKSGPFLTMRFRRARSTASKPMMSRSTWKKCRLQFYRQVCPIAPSTHTAARRWTPRPDSQSDALWAIPARALLFGAVSLVWYSQAPEDRADGDALPQCRRQTFGSVSPIGTIGTIWDFKINKINPTLPGEALKVKWNNKITGPHIFTVDPTVSDKYGGVDPQNQVQVIPHVHGAEVQSTSDGNPKAWWTADGKTGATYSTEEPTTPGSAVFVYPNEMPSACLFYHDHVMGATRLNVWAGLAGFYFIQPASEPAKFPSGKYEIPLLLQDRTFLTDGSLYYSSEGNNPDVHPNWTPEQLGNTIVVNGKVWPNLNVESGAYRFRLANGADSRFFGLSLAPVNSPAATVPFTMIGTDAGFLQRATNIGSYLLLAPGERADLLVDFSAFPAGTKLILSNNAPSPYPAGDLPDEHTSVVMQITVGAVGGAKMPNLGGTLNVNLLGAFPNIPATTATRQIVLNEVQGDDGPLGLFLNGFMYGAPATEVAKIGSTEDWLFINPTMDTHPMHLHLVAFQLVSRQSFNGAAYVADWLAANGNTGLPFPANHTLINLPVDTYLVGAKVGPSVSESGFKDVLQVPPGMVTVARVRFTSRSGKPFPFDASKGPGYVYHCHILSHEVG